MEITNKVAYFKKKETFESIMLTIPVGLNPIVFIEDTREMWTCGTYFSIGYPSILVSEESGTVKVSIGNSFFMMSTAGESLSIRKGDGNRIILSSNALSKIDTEAPLYWDIALRKLYHTESGVISGSYGLSTNLGNASIFVVPQITVDVYGHIISAENHNIEIRDYVELLSPSSSLTERSVLLSYNEANEDMDTALVRKGRGITYNDSLLRLTVQGGVTSNGPVNIDADLTVTSGYIIGNLKGNVDGEAKPKIHLSKTPEFGGASTHLYGHVLLLDILNVKPDPSSTNEGINNNNVTAIAASPLMVWNAIETAKDYADSLLGSNNAMVFKGNIEAGTTSPGTFTPLAELGNTYVVTFGSGTYNNNIGYINGEPVEVGDLIICKEATLEATVNDYIEVNKRWTFVQTNTTGVVVGPTSSTVGQVAIFNNTSGTLIKGLANGNVGLILTINDLGIPAWKAPAQLTWRPIKQYIEDKVVEILSTDPYSGSLIFKEGGNLKIKWDDASNTLTFTAISDNTWRPVFTYTIDSDVPVQIGTESKLLFSSDFLLVNGEIVEGWAYVDLMGNITYSR